MFRKIGWMTVTSFSWQHRGTVLRTLDLLLRAPSLVRSGRTSDAVTEARLIAALDRRVPAAMDLRIADVHQGDVVLRGAPAAASLEVARTALLGVPDVVEVRSGRCGPPILDRAAAGAPA